jgi:hypothetical protein
MKMSPEFTRAQANMRPGVITSDGFLGDDSRPIVDIISDDEAAMERNGLEIGETVALMRRLMDEGRKGLGEPVTVDDRWMVQVFEARGFLASPFEDGIFRKVNAQVTLLEDGKPTGQSILFSDLSLHLIEEYHFFQGKGASFRLSPVSLKRVLFAG